MWGDALLFQVWIGDILLANKLSELYHMERFDRLIFDKILRVFG